MGKFIVTILLSLVMETFAHDSKKSLPRKAWQGLFVITVVLAFW